MLVGLAGGAGDTHRHGRSVAIVEFSSGNRVVYKPRSLDVDRASATGRVDQRPWAVPAAARGAALIREDHGWAEFVAKPVCLARRDRRGSTNASGAYLAMLHALEATDFHYENVIASGEFPMLIDLEALFHPLAEPANRLDEPEWMGWRHFSTRCCERASCRFERTTPSVEWARHERHGRFRRVQQTPNRFPVLVGPGTDEMRLVRGLRRASRLSEPANVRRQACRSGCVRRIASVPGSRRDVPASARKSRRAARAGRPDAGVCRDAIRVVLRPTRQYALILSRATTRTSSGTHSTAIVCSTGCGWPCRRDRSWSRSSPRSTRTSWPVMSRCSRAVLRAEIS